MASDDLQKEKRSHLELLTHQGQDEVTTKSDSEGPVNGGERTDKPLHHHHQARVPSTRQSSEYMDRLDPSLLINILDLAVIRNGGGGVPSRVRQRIREKASNLIHL
ncbi:unnamed protein product [Taenia asiatica]|uniref:Uncharacterized protein n=1 Tax=Taenia asiatica TaxID=60517 RepID=A0A0R3WBP0_TAEAS|nr:unnamed protein product [Taenia asiatica]